jgi:hypothetical protein
VRGVGERRFLDTGIELYVVSNHAPRPAPRSATVLTLSAPLDASASAAVFVSTRDASRVLGVSAATLATWRVRGGGPPFRKIGAAGRLVRYGVVDLIAFAEQRPAMASTSDCGPLAAA